MHDSSPVNVHEQHLNFVEGPKGVALPNCCWAWSGRAPLNMGTGDVLMGVGSWSFAVTNPMVQHVWMEGKSAQIDAGGESCRYVGAVRHKAVTATATMVALAGEVGWRAKGRGGDKGEVGPCVPMPVHQVFDDHPAISPKRKREEEHSTALQKFMRILLNISTVSEPVVVPTTPSLSSLLAVETLPPCECSPTSLQPTSLNATEWERLSKEKLISVECLVAVVVLVHYWHRICMHLNPFVLSNSMWSGKTTGSGTNLCGAGLVVIIWMPVMPLLGKRHVLSTFDMFLQRWCMGFKYHWRNHWRQLVHVQLPHANILKLARLESKL
ncbi:hypothetical protein H4582DRAFT_2058045 [Lactarius indigo]|nr:hypothetical protein H4582DRAFT_2058044 [Lactarius indigo]KAI9437731.1 hypothetical protein H4582DRAFT_2058045 [Lactarius indigo]